MESAKIFLTPRLQKIADLVPKCDTVADIGTDHAYIPLYLIKEEKIKKAIASDIKKGPVMRAKENIKQYGADDAIEVRLGPGLETVSPGEANVIVVAGMGGILISDILNASPEVVGKAGILILQPMTAVRELREYLCEKDFEIEGEYVVSEENKMYNIIVCKPHGETKYSMRELYLGRGTQETSPEVYEKYKSGIIRKIKRQIDGLGESILPENIKKREELIRTLNLLK